ncbi:7-methyl-GTP pyrophosphatase isoform X2 [Benincasa hispida]|uniref:7-methyl-GTP pyrophosphatase isoform X2 n=1 Tax=Benincasa hispida TaxID=102211 RepID=UPI001900C94D|nr:7-methyl-GTP pyrophosphatase isoform X2 [Benincasa hispida]
MDANSSSFKIILGSSSVARRKILSEMGYEFTIMSADIDEKAIRKERPEELVVALAEAKADAIISNLQKIHTHEKEAEPTILIAADTVVIYEGVIREKPASKEEARQFMKDFSGGHAATLGSVFVTNLKTGFRKGEWDRVEIFFDEIPDEVIDKLVEEGSVLNVAGGLIIEHPLILPHVKEVVSFLSSFLLTMISSFYSYMESIILERSIQLVIWLPCLHSYTWIIGCVPSEP